MKPSNILLGIIAVGFAALFLISEFERKSILKENNSDEKFIDGYLTGAYQCLKSDTLVLKFAGTYDLTPSQQEDCIDILDMSRAVHQQIEMFFPDIKDYLDSL